MYRRIKPENNTTHNKSWNFEPLESFISYSFYFTNVSFFLRFVLFLKGVIYRFLFFYNIFLIRFFLILVYFSSFVNLKFMLQIKTEKLQQSLKFVEELNQKITLCKINTVISNRQSLLDLLLLPIYSYFSLLYYYS